MNELQNAATGGKNQDRTRNSVLRQMALLQSMSLEQLREKWLDLYGATSIQSIVLNLANSGELISKQITKI